MSDSANITPADLPAAPRRPRRLASRLAPKPREERRGLLIVNTGNGKGKTTAALGMVLRSVGYEMHVGMFQFIKSVSNPYGEHVAAERLGMTITPLGDGFTWLTENIDDDRRLAREGWETCRTALRSGVFDVLILDEMTYPLTFGWLDIHEVIEELVARPAGTHVIVTGRNAPPELIAAADLVTEMHLVKHPFREKGIGAQAGIEL
jgi:cob(I)alamin adenosyltransferase